MARSFVLGGVSATGLATGQPYIKRIVRTNGLDVASEPADGLTCAIVGGEISFRTDGAETDGLRKAWNAGADGEGGELLFVEFPSTTRTLSVQLEAAETVADNSDAAATANNNIRLKVMLTAPGQVVQALDSNGAPITGVTDTMQPVANGNFIEIVRGDTATINARTKGVFILIQHFAGPSIFTDTDGTVGIEAGLQVGVAADAKDAVSILVTAVLDHEGFNGSNGVQSVTKSAANAPGTQRKIWPLSTNGSDGVG